MLSETIHCPGIFHIWWWLFTEKEKLWDICEAEKVKGPIYKSIVHNRKIRPKKKACKSFHSRPSNYKHTWYIFCKSQFQNMESNVAVCSNSYIKIQALVVITLHVTPLHTVRKSEVYEYYQLLSALCSAPWFSLTSLSRRLKWVPPCHTLPIITKCTP